MHKRRRLASLRTEALSNHLPRLQGCSASSSAAHRCLSSIRTEDQAVDRAVVLLCPGFDVVEFDDLESLRAESTNWGCEYAGVRFDDGEESADKIASTLQKIYGKGELGQAEK